MTYKIIAAASLHARRIAAKGGAPIPPSNVPFMPHGLGLATLWMPPPVPVAYYPIPLPRGFRSQGPFWVPAFPIIPGVPPGYLPVRFPYQ